MSRLAVAMCSCLIVASCAGPDGTQGDSGLTPSEEQAIGEEILALATAADRAVDELDCATGVKVFVDSEALFIANGFVVNSVAELEALCTQMIEGRTGADYQVERSRVEVLSRDAAYLFREGRYLKHYEDRTVERHLVISDVWARQSDGSWKRLHFHESSRDTSEPEGEA